MPKGLSADNSSSVSKRGLVIAAVILIAVLAIAATGYQVLVDGQVGADSSAQSTGTLEPDREALMLAAYDCTIRDAGDNATTFTEIAQDRPLVVNFWATWCPYCLQEMDDYQAIFDEYSDRVAFAFVDATDGTRETVDKARSWIEDNGYTFPVYYDTTQAATGTFGVRSLPTTMVVAANGEILTISAGVIDPDLMRSALDSLV